MHGLAGGSQMIWAYHPLPGCMSCGSCPWRTMMGAMTSGPLRPRSLRAVAALSCLRRSCSRIYVSALDSFHPGIAHT